MLCHGEATMLLTAVATTPQVQGEPWTSIHQVYAAMRGAGRPMHRNGTTCRSPCGN